MTKNEVISLLGYTYVPSLESLNEWLDKDFSNEYSLGDSSREYFESEFPMYMRPIEVIPTEDYDKIVVFATITIDTMNKLCGE